MLEINRRLTEMTVGFFLIGGHSVSSALLSDHFGAAILNSLTVAACVLILVGVGKLTGAMKAEEPLIARQTKRKRQLKKPRR